ncbi:hypothetical protein D3C73_1058080 [compost metagenome]
MRVILQRQVSPNNRALHKIQNNRDRDLHISSDINFVGYSLRLINLAGTRFLPHHPADEAFRQIAIRLFGKRIQRGHHISSAIIGDRGDMQINKLTGSMRRRDDISAMGCQILRRSQIRIRDMLDILPVGVIHHRREVNIYASCRRSVYRPLFPPAEQANRISFSQRDAASPDKCLQRFAGRSLREGHMIIFEPLINVYFP